MGETLTFIGGFVTGVGLLYLLVKKGILVRITSDDFALKVPIIGKIARLSLLPYPGIFTGEYLEFKEKLAKLRKLLDPDRVFLWADRYGVDYISTEGDRWDGSWSPHRMAFVHLGQSHKRPYRLHMNPHLDTKALSIKLSADTGEVLSEEDVYPFVFLHELGHTSFAGNKNFLGLVMEHTISGQRHSLEARRKLFAQKKEIEQYADQFALEALKRWRSNS